LIAFTDHRYHNRDIGGGRHLDIVMKTSMDKGATWSSPEQMVAKGGNGIATSFDCAHGDAAVVVDKKSGRILLMCASGGIGYWESKRGHLLMMGRYYSDGGGRVATSTAAGELFALFEQLINRAERFLAILFGGDAVDTGLDLGEGVVVDAGQLALDPIQETAGLCHQLKLDHLLQVTHRVGLVRHAGSLDELY
jgi:hypothetical protein